MAQARVQQPGDGVPQGLTSVRTDRRSGQVERDALRGVLVLSRFTIACGELTEASNALTAAPRGWPPDGRASTRVR